MLDALLAIVIPAYKPDFLRAALQSIANQEVKNFRVYVGDDASPADLVAICRSFETVLDLHYVRFESNLGQSDLTAHWNRCVRMSSEPWVWLFSDDDLMEPGCTALLQQGVQNHGDSTDLFHFNAIQIDANGVVQEEFPAFPEILSGRAFALARLQFRLVSFAPDYVFSRPAFERVGGFVNFPLAWCSDDATWVALAGNKGIVTLEGSRICWRLSGINISSRSTASQDKKFEAFVQYLDWLQRHLATHPPQQGDLPDEEVLAWAPAWLVKQLSYVLNGLSARQAWQLAWRLRHLKDQSLLRWLWRCSRLVIQQKRSRRDTRDNCI